MAGLQWLCGMLSQKANTSGYYPDMSVGKADTCGADDQALGIRPINLQPIDLQPVEPEVIEEPVEDTEVE